MQDSLLDCASSPRILHAPEFSDPAGREADEKGPLQ